MAPAHSVEAGSATSTDRPFRFLDLPTEIRNHIYLLLLPRPGFQRQIDIVRQKTSAKADYRSCAAVRALVTICRQNRQLNREAAPVLYGNLEFYFHTAWAMHHWLTNIGSMIEYIRHVELHGFWSAGEMHSALNQLKQAKSLRVFDPGLGALGERVQVIARACKYFLEVWGKKKLERGEMDEVLNVVRVRPGYMPPEMAHAVTQQLRAELKELLV